MSFAAMGLQVCVESYELRTPFAISGHVFTSVDVALVTLSRGDHVGRGEAAGVYYAADTPKKIQQQIEAQRGVIDSGLDRQRLQRLLPTGGARNALDCALWDLEAKEAGVPVWKLVGLALPVPLLTTWTLGAQAPVLMANRAAVEFAAARALKLKLLGDSLDIDRVRAVRAARPDVWLAVDANQGLDPISFQRLLPFLIEADVKLIEQPFPVGREDWGPPMRSRIPLAADESIQGLTDVRRFAECFDVFNIKLDKCGGLTEALEMAREIRALGKQLMVGNMLGTSLAMAPAFVVGQLCDVVDLDGPLLLKHDRTEHVTYYDGRIACPEAVWGARALQGIAQ
jgi:L-alanine-DL-glutamate epimerase-like enolase superfamily enzyme